MSTYLIIKRTILVATLLLIVGIPSLSTQAAEQSSGVSIASASAGDLGMVASGAVEDTLKACLARIPKDASIGQRMMAERSCQYDEGIRKTAQTAPTF